MQARDHTVLHSSRPVPLSHLHLSRVSLPEATAGRRTRVSKRSESETGSPADREKPQENHRISMNAELVSSSRVCVRFSGVTPFPFRLRTASSRFHLQDSPSFSLPLRVHCFCRFSPIHSCFKQVPGFAQLQFSLRVPVSIFCCMSSALPQLL